MHKIVSRRFSRLSSLVFVLALLAMCVGNASADIIRLKNGQRITGKIVGYSDRKFTIVYERSSPDTRATIALDDIDSVEFDGRPLPSGYSSTYGDGGTTGGRNDGTTNDSGGRRNDGTSSGNTGGGSTASTPDRDRDPSPNTSTGGYPSGNTGNPPSGSSGNMRIVTANVVARDDWTYAKIDVQKGDRVSVTANGTIRLSSRLESTPEGIEVDDRNKLLQDRPTGALIAVIGDDNDDFIFIGKGREFTAARSGKLFLSVNEGDLSDNSGSYTARIQVDHR